jgi:hypothetical protein
MDAVLTTAASRARAVSGPVVTTLPALLKTGLSESEVRAHLSAGRWQRFGRAIVRHNADPSRHDVRSIVLVNAGSRAVLTAFTALEDHGLRGWERDDTHVLVPGGTHVKRIPGVPIRVHYTGTWDEAQELAGRRLHRVAPSLALAAATFRNPRPACGILAAAVQQRLVMPEQLAEVIAEQTWLCHHAVLRLALDDIAQGAQALSEIDLGRLCNRFGLPAPMRQDVRLEEDGRRRYLDAVWVRRDGKRVVVEVDGALHLVPRRWWDDQLRQNELVIAGSLVLRFPSVIARLEPGLVADQLRRIGIG